jgi:hypothetical protein
MPYLNSRLFALVATALSLAAVPGLHAQEASVAAAAVRGDVDGDGRVTRADADAVRAYLVRGTLPAGRSIMPAGDANGDGRVTAADAALISRFAAGVDVSRFGVGRPVSEGGGRRVSPQGTMMFTEYECGVDTRTRTLRCEMVGAGVEGGARSDVLLLGAGAKFNGTPTSSYVTGDVRDTMKVTVSIKNLLPQPIGTTDGVTADTVRVVFTAWRTTTVSSLAYSVADAVTANGTATFTDSVNGGSPVLFTNRQYMDFPGLIAPNDTSQAREIKIAYQKGLSGDFKFQYRIWSRVQYNKGNVVISPADSLIGAGQSISLSGASFSVIGAPLAAESYTWSSSNPAIATVNASTGQVTGVSGGTVTITATSNSESQRGGTRVIRVIQANVDAATATGNVRVSTPTSVLDNDSPHPARKITFAGWNGTPNVTWKGGQVTMDTVTASPNRGKFVYNPPAGLQGAAADSVAYTLQAGTAVTTGKVAITVQDMVWFVGGGGIGTPCASPNLPASDLVCGRLTDPYPTLADFQADNTGALGRPGAGHSIFIYEGTYGGAVTLLAQQKLIGQDATATLSAISGITPVLGSDTFPAMKPAGGTVTINGTSGGVVLGADNLLRGFTITPSGGTALSGTGFGTPTIAEVSIAATAGPALSLNNGTLNGTFPSVTSTNSTGRGISLTGVNGTPTFTAGSISGSAQTALFVSGGNVGFTWPGSIGQASATPLLAVSGGHSGTLTFSGALTSTGGPGMQFNDADGVYNLNGTANLSGDSAAVDITNGSDGTFSFNSGTQITNAAGATNSAFYVYGSAPTLVSYAGSITKSGASVGRLVELGEMTGGTVTFTGTSTLNSTSSAGTGISFSNVAATVGFNGTTTLNGGDAGIDILAASSGTFTFGANTLVQNPTGTAFNVNASAPAITFNGSLIRTANNALLVDLTTVAAGKTILFDPAAGTDSLYATIGDGIQLSNVDGAVDFNARVRLAGGNAGVDIINGSSGNIDFDAATIVNPTGDALRIFNGSGSDQATDVAFVGSSSISTNAGRPVLVEDVGSGTVAVSASINATGQGLLVQNNSGGTITFSSATQTLNTAANAAVTLSSNTGATVNFTGGALAITTTSGAGLNVTGGGTVNVTGVTNTVTSTTGTPVSISSTTIGSSGVEFLSVSANGAANGIFLSGTGNSGGQFHVKGGSTAGSGGNILNTSGGDGATGGNGVYLANANNVNLNWINLSGHANHAVRGTSVSNVTLTRLRITGTNGTNAGFDEGSVSFTNLTGSASITSSYIEGGFEDNVRVANTTGTLNRLTMTSDTIGFNGTSGNDGVLLDASSTATLNATVQNSRFLGSRSNNVHYVLNNDAAGDFVFSNNVLTNTHPNKLGSDFGINVGSTSNGAMTYAISGNSVRDAGGSGIEVSHLAGGSGSMTGSITGNTVGVAGVSNSGSVAGSTIVAAIVGAGTTATHTTTITGNTLRQYTNYGIRLINRGTGNGYLNAVVKTNNIAEPSPNAAAFAAYSGIRAELGASSVGPDDGRTCLDISGNTLNQTGSSTQADLRVFARFGTRTSLLGLGQGGASSVPNTFLQNQNTITVAPGGFGAVNATSTNPFQSTCPPV